MASPPYSVTQPAGPVRSTSATLNGMVVPRGERTMAWFEWGTNGWYESSTEPVEVGAGTATVRVSTKIDDLATGGVYNYRLVASNASGTVSGFRHLLTTGIRVASWGEPTFGFVTGPVMTNIVSIACGHGHTLCVRNDGTVAASAYGYYSSRGQANVPAGLSNVVAVAGGYSHSLALKEDGTLVAWGKDASWNPIVVPDGLSNVIAVAAGDWHTVALKSDGTVVTWGSQNSRGQLSIPRGLSNVVAVSAGSEHSIALKADGTIVAWGRSGGAYQTPPTGLTNVAMISTEGWHNLAVRTDGTVVGWGSLSRNYLTPPSGLCDVLAVADGFDHSLALTNGGQLVAWGYSTWTNLIPSDVRDVVAIASGDYHSVVLSPVNSAPRALSRTYSREMDADAVIPLAGQDPNGDPLAYSLLSLPTNGVVFQYVNGGRGEQISTPGPVTDSSGRIIFVPQSSALGMPYDSFTFKVSDGECASAPAVVTVNVAPKPIITPIGFTGVGTNRTFSFSFTGLPNVSYSVETSSTLESWLTLTNTQSVSGVFTIVDPGVTNQPVRFYRLWIPTY